MYIDNKLLLLFLVSDKSQEDEKTKRVGLLESSNEKVNKRMKLFCLETNLNFKRNFLLITTEDNFNVFRN